jgi:hypothetical protein
LWDVLPSPELGSLPSFYIQPRPEGVAGPETLNTDLQGIIQDTAALSVLSEENAVEE